MTSKVKIASNYILSHIKDGSWPVGTKIPSENQLCEELAISRTSVRGAIGQYVSIGLLESRHGKGTFVRSVDLRLLGNEDGAFKARSLFEDQRMVHQARDLVEPEILAYVAEFATPELIEELEGWNRKMIESLGNQKEFIHADMNFHRAMVRFLNNRYLTEFFEPLLDRDDVNGLNNDMFGYYDGVQTHQSFMEAIREHNPDKARRLSVEYHQKKQWMIQDITQKAQQTAATG
ncbi:MAG: FadR/GntR family transcriptional regulator [bacterium]